MNLYVVVSTNNEIPEVGVHVFHFRVQCLEKKNSI